MPSPNQDDPANPPADDAQPNTLFAELRRRKVFRVAITYAIVAWLVIQVAAATFPGFDIPRWAFRFVVLMLLLGFPLSLIITWAFELTPDGIKRTQKADDAPSNTSDATHDKKRNWMAFLFAALLPTAIFGTLAVYFYIQTKGEAPAAPSIGYQETEALEKSIAVLPFDNRSKQDDDRYFTDGIHDDLLTYISRIRDIKTISRTSVMPYRDTEKSMSEIGQDLSVAYILEGGVQRSGDQIRINVQLINAAADNHVWAEIYTRKMTAENVFAIQSEISETIAAQLKAVLSPEEKQRIEKLPTQNMEALEAYFRGQASSENDTKQKLEKAVRHFERAVELDPQFAEAYAALAIVHYRLIHTGGLPVETQAAKAQPLIDRALELDPSLAMAYAAQAGVSLYRDRAYEGAEAAYRQAIELSPNNADIYTAYGYMLIYAEGRIDDGVALAEKAADLDPENQGTLNLLGTAYFIQGKAQKAESHFLKLIEKNENAKSHVQLGDIYMVALGRYDLAVFHLRKAYALDPHAPTAARELGQAYRVVGLKDEARFWFARAIAISPNGVDTNFYRLELAAMSGDEESLRSTALENLKDG